MAMHIKIERPRDRVDKAVRVFLDGIEISRAVTAVTVPMRVGDASTVLLELIGDVEIVTTESTKPAPPQIKPLSDAVMVAENQR